MTPFDEIDVEGIKQKIVLGEYKAPVPKKTVLVPTYVVIHEEAQFAHSQMKFYFEYNDYYFLLCKLRETQWLRIKFDRKKQLIFRNNQEITTIQKKPYIDKLMSEIKFIFKLIKRKRAVILTKTKRVIV
ncbi:MAG: hypothetical protein ACI9BD_000015 [Candidatus Marinamargulisbacteria bacterium]|jgi:hypothetical protein